MTFQNQVFLFQFDQLGLHCKVKRSNRGESLNLRPRVLRRTRWIPFSPEGFGLSAVDVPVHAVRDTVRRGRSGVHFLSSAYSLVDDS